MNGSARSRLLGVSPLLMTVILTLVATACGGTEVAVDVNRPQMTTVVEAFVEDDAPPPKVVVDWAGDELAPGLGNGGYDVISYHLEKEWNPEFVRFDATVLVTATALVGLERFHLDYEGGIVRAVEVNGVRSEYEHLEPELVVIPAEPIDAGSTFDVAVEYRTYPEDAKFQSELASGPVGWIATADPAWYTRSAPDGAHHWLPTNDHPSDPAVYTARLTVPEGMTAVAPGRFRRQSPGVEQIITEWETSGAIPPHATTVIFGGFDLVEDEAGTNSTGVQLRHLLPPTMKGELPAVLQKADDMILFLEQRLGPFPYDAWGVAIVADSAPTKPAHSWTIITSEELESSDVELRMMRDLTTHYFGHAVGIETWSDVWISEAIPTYMQWLWLQGIVGRSGLDVTIAAARAKVNNSGWPAPHEPRPGDVYVGSGALRGALFLHALSLRVGQAAFFDVLASAYRDHRGQTLSTEELVTLAEDVTDERLRAFADAWFHREPLPGFPDS